MVTTLSLMEEAANCSNISLIPASERKLFFTILPIVQFIPRCIVWHGQTFLSLDLCHGCYSSSIINMEVIIILSMVQDNYKP